MIEQKSFPRVPSMTQVVIEIPPTQPVPKTALSPLQIRDHALRISCDFLYKSGEFESGENLARVNKATSRAWQSIVNGLHPITCQPQDPHLIAVRNALFPQSENRPLSLWDLYRVEKVLNHYGKKMGKIWKREFHHKLVYSGEFHKAIDSCLNAHYLTNDTSIIYQKLRLVLCINPLNKSNHLQSIYNRNGLAYIYRERTKPVDHAYRTCFLAFLSLIVIAGVGVGVGIPLYPSMSPESQGAFLFVFIFFGLLSTAFAGRSLNHLRQERRLAFNPDDLFRFSSDPILQKMTQSIFAYLIQSGKSAVTYESLRAKEIRAHLESLLPPPPKKSGKQRF